MWELVIYSLKAGACLAVFYLFFKLALSRETLHRFNRLLILGAVGLSFALPLCIITIERERPVPPVAASNTVAITVPAAIEAPADKPFPWKELGGALFVAGILLTLGATLRSILQVRRIIRRGRHERLDSGATLVRVDEAVSPFSWGRHIVVSERDLAENGREILIHEQAHLRFGHTWDLLALDLAGAFQWFNPAMWLLRRELRAIHEYEADAEVLRSGVDARHYQMLLIKKAVGGRWYSVANSLNHSNLKNRITMMLQKRSSRWTGARALLVLPLAGLALGSFARTVYVLPKDKGTKESATIQAFDAENIEKLAGTSQFNSLGELGSADQFNSLDGLGSDGQLNNLDSLQSLEISTGSKTFTIKGCDKVSGLPDGVIYLVDGVETESLEGIGPEQIASIEIRKDPDEVKAYGERGRNGVVKVTLRKPGEPVPDPRADTPELNLKDVVVVAYGADTPPAQGRVVRIRKNTEEADGSAATDAESTFTVTNTSTAGQQSTVVVNGGKTTVSTTGTDGKSETSERFSVPVSGKSTSMSTTTTTGTDGKSETSQTIHISGNVSVNNAIEFQGVVVIDGKRSNVKKLRKLEPGQIDHITILKGATAVAAYGEEASEGAMVVVTRK